MSNDDDKEDEEGGPSADKHKNQTKQKDCL